MLVDARERVGGGGQRKREWWWWWLVSDGGGWRVVCVAVTTISNKYSNSD